MEKVIEALKWLTTLDFKALFRVVIAVVVGGLCYGLYRQQEYIKEQDARNVSDVDRLNSNISVLQKANDDCAEQRYQDVQKTAELYRERIEVLERRAETNQKNIEVIKENK